MSKHCKCCQRRLEEHEQIPKGHNAVICHKCSKLSENAQRERRTITEIDKLLRKKWVSETDDA